MMSEGIDNSSDAPTIFLVVDWPNVDWPKNDGPNHSNACFDCACESGMRICHDHPHRGTSPKLSAQRLGAEILVDHRSTLVLDAEQFARSERGLVELDRLRPVSNREHWEIDVFWSVVVCGLLLMGSFLSCGISP